MSITGIQFSEGYSFSNNWNKDEPESLKKLRESIAESKRLLLELKEERHRIEARDRRLLYAIAEKLGIDKETI